MTIRAYKPAIVPLLNLSLENRRKRIVMEKRNVDRVIIHEPTKLVTLVIAGREEFFDHNDYCLEIIEGEPDDRLTEGITLEF